MSYKNSTPVCTNKAHPGKITLKKLKFKCTNRHRLRSNSSGQKPLQCPYLTIVQGYLPNVKARAIAEDIIEERDKGNGNCACHKNNKENNTGINGKSKSKKKKKKKKNRLSRKDRRITKQSLKS